MSAISIEILLHTPDHNVSLVSLRKPPTIILGFNEHIARSYANTGTDVMDWFELTFYDIILSK